MGYIVKEFDNLQEFQDCLNKTKTEVCLCVSRGYCDDEGNYDFLELIDKGVRGDKYFVVAYHHSEEITKDKTIAEGLTDPTIVCGGCGKEYQESGYVYGCSECPDCGHLNWVEKKEVK